MFSKVLSQFSFGILSFFLVANASALTPVVINYETEVTSATSYQGETQGDINEYFPVAVSVGDTLTGYYVYDLDFTTDAVPDDEIFGIYEGAALCAGISINGIDINVKPPTPDIASNYVNIRNDVNFISVPSDQFTLGAAERVRSFLPEVSVSSSAFNRNLINLGFYTNSPDSNPLSILTDDSMQVMPASGWENIQMYWGETNSETSTELGIESNTSNFTVSVTQGFDNVPAGCELNPSIVQPAPEAQLESSDVYFEFSDNGARVDRWWLYVGSSVGSRDYIDSGNLNALNSVTATGLPTDGSTVYVRLWYGQIGVPWSYIDAEYTATLIAVPEPSIYAPEADSQLADTEVNFMWDANDGSFDDYWLYVGSSAGDNDYFDSSNIGGTTNAIVSGLPNDASTVYARLWYRQSGDIWRYVDSQYVAAPNPDGPELASPEDQTQLSGQTQQFNWRDNGSDVDNWWLYAGSTIGGFQYYNSGKLSGNVTNATATGLPNSGETIYVRLWYLPPQGGWQSKDYTYTAIDQGGSPEIVNIESGDTLTGPTQTFVWQSNSIAVEEWWLYVGSNEGGSQYLDSGSMTASTTFAVASGLPEDGTPIYVRLWYKTGGRWSKVDSQYIANTE